MDTEEEKISAIEKAISTKRFSKYVETTHRNRQEALKLYKWNKNISREFYYLVQETEVILRTAIHSKLTESYKNEFWFDIKDLLKNDEKDRITGVKNKKDHTGRKNRNLTSDLIISRLTFGFWVNLFDDYYETKLWRKGLLSSIFPNEVTRNMVYKKIKRLSRLRNRIAHHEPIFMENLENQYNDILTLLKWLSQHEVYAWLSSATEIPSLLKEFDYNFNKHFK